MTLTIPIWLFTALKWGAPLVLFLPWPWYRRVGDFDFGPAVIGAISFAAACAWWGALIVSAVFR